jgi:hypothetical protein
LFSHEAVVAAEGGVATELPRERAGEAGEGVEEGPGDDHVVVDDHKEGDDQHSIAEALQPGSHPAEELERPLAGPLAQGQLQEEERKPGDKQHEDIGDQEGHSWGEGSFKRCYCWVQLQGVVFNVT